MKLQEPFPINENVITDIFSSGEEQLDEWLRKRALKNELIRASRTFVVCENNEVVGYYSLAVGSVSHPEAIGRIKRNMPDPVPVMILGRLAVDKNAQGKGIGAGLVKDAILRTLQASEIAGIKAILVHALHDKAALFYENRGFKRSPIDHLTLMISLEDVATIVGETSDSGT